MICTSVNGPTYFYKDLPRKSKLKDDLKGESQEKSDGPTDKRSNGLKSISQRDNPLDEVKVLSDGKASVYRLSPLNISPKLENKEQFCHALN